MGGRRPQADPGPRIAAQPPFPLRAPQMAPSAFCLSRNDQEEDSVA